jgi:hypothetical protein
MTVSWRRSASGAGADPVGCTLPDTASPGAPHCPQNRFLGALLLPQAWQNHGSGSPQSPQNFWLLATRV